MTASEQPTPPEPAPDGGGGAPATPLRQRSRLIDDINDYLRREIYSGRLPPGTRLRQEELAEKLQVSRTPLREALRMLESEGLLSLTRGHGVEVASADRQTLLDACYVREVIDGLAARLAAERVKGDLEEELEGHLARQEACLDPWDQQGFAQADADFHESIIRSTGNRFIIAKSSIVRMTVQVFLPVTRFNVGRAPVALSEHRRIAGSILVGDALGAELAARYHIRVTIEAVLRAQEADRLDPAEAT